MNVQFRQALEFRDALFRDLRSFQVQRFELLQACDCSRPASVIGAFCRISAQS